jgi:hypothetical protein
MKMSLGLWLLLPLWSCADPLKEAQTLEQPRVLGVRIVTQSGRASPQPGEDAELEVLLAGPDGTLDAQMAYRFCTAQGSTRGVPFCAAPAFAEDTVTLNGSAIPIAIPRDVEGGAQLVLLAVACLTSEPRLSESPLSWSCAGRELPLRFSFDARASGATFANNNPELPTLKVTSNGVALPVDELRHSASCDADAPTLAAGAVHRLEIALGADAREPGESLQLSHFSTSGSFERQYSFVEGEQEPEATLTWRAPEAGVAVKQYVVVRDDRGGVSWASWSFCTR